MKKQMNEYALYHGDEFICLGTIEEIAMHIGVKKSTIRFYLTPTYKKRRLNGYILIKIED